MPSDRNPNGGLLYKLEHYKRILIKGRRLGTAGEIQQRWLAFAARLGNQAVPLNDATLINALRSFQVSTCVDQNYLKLPRTYSLCQFVTDPSEVVIPIASRQEIEGKQAVPDYGVGVKGTVADGVYFAQQ